MVQQLKDLPALPNQICWQNLTLQRFQSCHGALKRQVQHVCSAISPCQMVHRRMLIPAMFFAAL